MLSCVLFMNNNLISKGKSKVEELLLTWQFWSMEKSVGYHFFFKFEELEMSLFSAFDHSKYSS